MLLHEHLQVCAIGQLQDQAPGPRTTRGCVSAQLRCADAAHLAARAAARGDAPVDVVTVGRSVAPSTAEVIVERRGGKVHVLVTVEVRPFGSGSTGH